MRLTGESMYCALFLNCAIIAEDRSKNCRNNGTQNARIENPDKTKNL